MTLCTKHRTHLSHSSSRPFLRPDVLKCYPSAEKGRKIYPFLPEKRNVEGLTIHIRTFSEEISMALRHGTILFSVASNQYRLSLYCSRDYLAATWNTAPTNNDVGGDCS